MLLLLCAFVTAAPLPGASGGTARARTAASPAFAAGAGFAATYTESPGGLLLALAVGALAAAVFAAVGRTFLDPDQDELVDIWLVVGGALAVVVTVLLLVGAAPHALWSVLFAAAVVAARLLPYTVVDVPDEALLDLDRLAVTAWSARERPRGSSRRRSTVRVEGVTTVVHRGLRLVTAGTFVIAGTVALTGPLLVLGADLDRQGIGSLVMVGLGGVALLLVARSFRSALPRMALRVAATWVLGFLGYAVLSEVGAHDRLVGLRCHVGVGTRRHGHRRLPRSRLAVGLVGAGGRHRRGALDRAGGGRRTARLRAFRRGTRVCRLTESGIRDTVTRESDA